MKFKMIGILSLILLAALALGSVCAADSNATDEIISMENTQESDVVSMERPSSEQVVENDSNQTVNSDAQSNDVLGVSNDQEVVLTSASTDPVLSVATTEPTKLTATKKTTTLKKATKKTTYIKFKGKSKYTWKIKKTTWNKMKKNAVNWYKKFRKVGSYHPGYSYSVKVTVTRGGHKYTGYAMAVKNYKGIRCEIRGVKNVFRISNWGDTYYV